MSAALGAETIVAVAEKNPADLFSPAGFKTHPGTQREVSSSNKTCLNSSSLVWAGARAEYFTKLQLLQEVKKI